jgi:hypothetical protein
VELLVVDSASTDGSVEATLADFPKARLLRLASNVGPGATRNLGLREAKTPFVLLVDHDNRVQPDAIRILHDELASDASLAGAAPRTYSADRPEKLQYDGGLWHFAGLPHMRGQDGTMPSEDPALVDVLTSGLLLLRREAALSAGGFDESFFYLIEDVEFCARLRFLGWKLVTVPRAVTVNAGGSAGLSLKGSVYPARRIALHSRNRCLMILGLYDFRTLVVLFPALLLFDLAWFAFATLSRHPLAFITGKLALIPRIPAILEKRRNFLPRKRLRDRDLLSAPPLTFTESALAQPLARRLTSLLDWMLQLFWSVLRGALA